MTIKRVTSSRLGEQCVAVPETWLDKGAATEHITSMGKSERKPRITPSRATWCPEDLVDPNDQHDSKSVVNHWLFTS